MTAAGRVAATLPLGKLDARDDDRDLRLARYAPKLLTPPASTKFSTAVKVWECWLNDRLGDCAIEDPAHAVELVTALGVGAEAKIGTPDVLRAYEDVGGYRPADPKNPQTNATDGGCVMGEVMDYWRRTGIGAHRIDGYARVNPLDSVEVKQATTFFCGAHLGLALPMSAQNQVGKKWTVGRGAHGAPGSWGGHAVLATGYDSTGLECVTWGIVQRMTWGFLRRYCDEMFVSLSAEWISPATKKSPQGIGMDDLRSDLLQFAA